jgi:hypothetical protein
MNQSMLNNYHSIKICRESIKNKRAIIKHLPTAQYRKEIQVLKYRIRQEKKELRQLRRKLWRDWLDLHLEIWRAI